jgi:pyruvate/2-oxoglutarate dehydrogenase complex dihydrolipoamide acyltransferase (E2) component
LPNTRVEQPAAEGDARTSYVGGDGYQTVPFLKIRRGYTDILAATKRKDIIHGLVEIDVTKAHRLMRQREAAGEDLSFTAFLIHAVARAVDEDRMMHAYRRRDRLILFDEVDVNTQIEAAVGGQRIVESLLIRSANSKSVEQLTSEIRGASVTTHSQSGGTGACWRSSASRDRCVRWCGDSCWGTPNGSSGLAEQSASARSACSARQVVGGSRSPRRR